MRASKSVGLRAASLFRIRMQASPASSNSCLTEAKQSSYTQFQRSSTVHQPRHCFREHTFVDSLLQIVDIVPGTLEEVQTVPRPQTTMVVLLIFPIG
ncbi:hypothetical protein BC938DRAFT_476129 [Jimgerdemannia flammicorona]|uniref:Uncharacterized protein n=1 Tax=Jimgerdemannia flammicorona TaxID=994334 RepID=A0A433PK06_9FUNG|nr:hypothetical protein BC938DRAFT_476129 [Jimgerdemannia flammicorona]